MTLIFRKGEREVKPNRCVMTAGVDDLKLGPLKISKIFSTAIRLYDQSYMTTFKPQDGKVVVEDGNGNVLDTIHEEIVPETIWVIGDDYGEYILFTALLPEEY
jgi:hypothetical protein